MSDTSPSLAFDRGDSTVSSKKRNLQYLSKLEQAIDNIKYYQSMTAAAGEGSRTSKSGGGNSTKHQVEAARMALKCA